MKRFHVHVNVADLDASIGFHSTLFGTAPSVRKPDYAKWMLEDPRINFAISDTGRVPGIDHLGLQVDSGEELAALGQRLEAAGGTLVPENATVCCYARSDKTWTEDPQGTRWETFHTFGEATTYHAADAACATDGAACTPDPQAMQLKTQQGASCCAPRSGCC
jgi:hypothetical protein